MNQLLDLNAIQEWWQRSSSAGENLLDSGYQGQLYLNRETSPAVVIKAATGRGLSLWGRRRMLDSEARAYERLTGVQGVPRFFGRLPDGALVLEYIAGEPFRRAKLTNHGAFFDALLTVIHELHSRGVAHSDLKKKENLIVVDGDQPFIVDFGAAVVRKNRFAPFNRFLFRLGCTFDFNAWVKLKYANRMDQVSASDQRYYNRTWTERFASWTKKRLAGRSS